MQFSKFISAEVFVITNIGAESYIVLDNKLCMNFNDTTAPILSFHNFPELTDILFCDSSSYIVSDSSSIYYYDEEYNFFVKLVDSQMHNICFRVSNAGIYYYDKDNGKELYFYQYSDTSSIKVCQFATPIASVAPLGSLCFVAYGKKTCMINENSEYTRLFETSSTINPNSGDGITTKVSIVLKNIV